MKIIFLIIAHDAENYNDLQKHWEVYMNTHPNIKSYFIKLKQNIDKPYLENNTIYTEGMESIIPGIIKKTTQSIKYLIDNKFEFDYIFRTNLSSVIKLDHFYNTILSLGTVQCAGVINKHENNSFLSGAGMLLNNQICKHLITDKTLDYDTYDDVAIGKFLIKNNYIMTPLKRSDYFINNPDVNNQHIINNDYHFRCICNNYKMTITVVGNLVTNIYKK